jgi:hypothetical protein
MRSGAHAFTIYCTPDAAISRFRLRRNAAGNVRYLLLERERVKGLTLPYTPPNVMLPDFASRRNQQ